MTPWHPLPQQVFKHVEHTPGTVLLHSSRPGESSCSRFFTAPLQILKIRQPNDLPALFSTIEDAVATGHFAAGYFAYECAQYFEPTVTLSSQRHSGLLAYFGIYDRFHTFDHTVGSFDSDPLLSEPASSEREGLDHQPSTGIRFGVDELTFTSRVEQIHNWIRGGDVYQLNFTFPLHVQSSESPSDLYARLSAAQPVDYGAFLHTDPGHHILSFSPELFFQIDQDRHIITQPMKGTAPRGRTAREDSAIAEWLSNDLKNRAENVMIVDLIRNDLGRICSFGSVQVEKLFDVERYPSLWQMTSRISGNLRPNVDFEEILRALFPCGSVTGAPKVRAMQLLAQIEQEPRTVYTGAIGYFSVRETAFNVAIRTLKLEKGIATGGVGSGIVIDSKPSEEYLECKLKAEFLTHPAEQFSLIETMLWRNHYPFLELHLDRLSDSAGYFGFVCDRASVHDALVIEASRFPDDHPRKVRLLLNRSGEMRIQTELLPQDSSILPDPPRICISAHPTNSGDRFLFHKTTKRAQYELAFTAASSLGFADTLFLNKLGEVTECAAHNILIEHSGRWYTPPLQSGVLPGVYRRYLFATRPEIQEKILILNDLKAADGVFICNAVRGLRRVTIDFESILQV